MKKLLCITPIRHIDKVYEKLTEFFNISYLPDPKPEDISRYNSANVIFTNPNKSKIYLSEEVLDGFNELELIATASTGTIHIDKEYCAEKKIKIISITEEIRHLEKITSTAELAFLLTLAGCRNIIPACKSVDDSFWDYERFIGRQMNQLTIGVLGFGRLGKMYARYSSAFGAKVLVCDPYAERSSMSDYKCVNAKQLFMMCDIISIHIHATKENLEFVNAELLQNARPNALIVNTARGEIINEQDMLDFLSANPKSKYFTDVLKEEYKGIRNSNLFNSCLYGKQIFITPHIGGMSIDAQIIAYNRCVDLILEYYGYVTEHDDMCI